MISNPYFKGTPLFDMTFKKQYKIGHLYNWILKGTNTRPTQQYDFEWFWLILSELTQFPTTWSVARHLCDSWASLLVILPYSVAFGVILSFLFVCLFVCLYGSGYLSVGWCDRREILAQGRANLVDGNEVVWGLAAPGGRKRGKWNFRYYGSQLGIFAFWAISQQRCTDPHQILFV